VQPPNILLFFPDEWRYDWGGLKNNPYYTADELPLRTPNFDAIAARGTRFSRAYVGAPVCAPSRACLASGRYHDETGLPQNFHNDYLLNITTFYSVLRDNGYHTMITGRDDLDKSSGGPGDDGSKHTAALGFSDSVRCDGSTDVTRGGHPHEPFGEWLVKQPVTNKTIARKYNCTNLFELQKKRYAELKQSYAIPDPMPLPDVAYQDNWIGTQAVALLKRKPAGKPWFIEVSHQAPHPPMDITGTWE
jgi:arylsulfatase A-like enzyme